MAVKQITHPETGKTVCFGRKHAIAHGAMLSLGNYLTRDLAAPPDAVDWTPAASAALSEVYGNNEEGDCTAAGPAHSIGVFTGNTIFNPTIFTLDQVNAFYSVCEGPPGFPAADNGADVPTVLNVWKTKGFLLNHQHNIAGWMKVSSSDQEQQRIAIDLFGNLVYGIDLPDLWVNPFPSSNGFVWDAAGPSDPDNGHCFVAVGYKLGMTLISTWGMTGWITDSAVEKYCAPAEDGEIYVVLAYDWIRKAKQRAPNGVLWSSLEADFKALGGSLVSPDPPTA